MGLEFLRGGGGGGGGGKAYRRLVVTDTFGMM